MKLCNGALFGSAGLLDEAAVVGQQCTEAVASFKAEANLDAPAKEPEYRHEKDAPPTISAKEEEQSTRLGGEPLTQPLLAGPPELAQLCAGVTKVDLDEDDIDLEAEEFKKAENLPPGTKIFDNNLDADQEVPGSARALKRITALGDAADEFVKAEEVRGKLPTLQQAEKNCSGTSWTSCALQA